MKLDETRPEADDLVERLVPLADDGPAIPADGAARVKAAVRPLWEREVQRRTRGRRLRWSATALAAAAAVAFAAIALWRVAAPPPPPAGQIEIVRGSVAVGHRGEPLQAAAPVALVRRGDAIRTGATGRAAIRLANDTVVRLDAGTSVVVRSPELLVLDAGALYVDSGTGSTIEIRTPFGVVRDVGTLFEVRLSGDATRVRVREGSVFVVAAGDATRVDRGRELVVGASGTLRAGTISPDDEAWDWILDVSPPFAIEGRTVAALLDWVERETGREVRYADATTEATAREAVLHGTLEGVRADEAPAVVLPSAGLEAVTRDGTLYVRPVQ
ncbi:MAG: FecR domain-containing protein [Thermoanaerobaculia bacterium]